MRGVEGYIKQARLDDKRLAALRRIYVSRSIGGVNEAAVLVLETVDKVKEIFGRQELEVVYVLSKGCVSTFYPDH
jgi:hypothetical protein